MHTLTKQLRKEKLKSTIIFNSHTNYSIPDKIIISTAALFHNELSVIQHKGTEDKKAQIQVHLCTEFGTLDRNKQ